MKFTAQGAVRMANNDPIFCPFSLPEGFRGVVRVAVTGTSVSMRVLWVPINAEGLPQGMAQLSATNYSMEFGTSTVLYMDNMTGGYALACQCYGGTGPAVVFMVIGEVPGRDDA